MPQFRIRKFKFLGREYRVVSARAVDRDGRGLILVTVVEEGKDERNYQILEVVEGEIFEPVFNWML